MFTDISTHKARNTIILARILGIARGYPDGTFKPDQPATRAEALTFAMRVLAWAAAGAVGGGLAAYYAVKKQR